MPLTPSSSICNYFRALSLPAAELRRPSAGVLLGLLGSSAPHHRCVTGASICCERTKRMAVLLLQIPSHPNWC
ncbi:hypothetical protein BU16DRAFT_527193 [Lophium mytilinum]|uniref:Uncharacterized protein n=1 Tax=Lophium mytilinum TaxID=390894 RepID=A0A6A6QTA0_9PEZI|nr:hypothetical protein BU16DRAFT_527193 [Lophium mytilinum]